MVHCTSCACAYTCAQGLDRLVCVSCGAVLAATENVLKMTQEGVGGIFVNPHGHVHEMVTFKRVRPEAVSYHGHPVSEHSWFPGYAWTICECMVGGRWPAVVML